MRFDLSVVGTGVVAVAVLITFATLLLLNAWDSPIHVDPRSLDGLLAWSTFALVLVTAGLLGAAVAAGLRVGEQITQDRLHHEEQIAALTRPALKSQKRRSRFRVSESTLGTSV